jgi:hypothetical protein
MLHPRNPDYPIATLQGIRFPFFSIEFKAAGGTRGDLWVAANQCAGASSACVNAVERLNSLLQEYDNIHVQSVDNVIYSIAVDNNTAQLYVSWKDNLNYFVQQVDAFLLWSPDHFKDFRKKVRNILDWGKDKRLKQIGDALDAILDENWKILAEHAEETSHERGRGRGRGQEHGRSRCSSSADDSVNSSAYKRKDKEKTSDHNLVSDHIPNLQSSNYEEDYDQPAQQPQGSNYRHITPAIQQPMAPTNSLQPATLVGQTYTTSRYNPTNDTSHAYPLGPPTHTTPAYSSENVSYSLESYQSEDSNTRGHKRARQ